MMRLTLYAAALAALVLAGEARAATITLSAVADTTLNQHSPNNNMGAYNQVLVGESGVPDARRGLFLFDVAGALPAGAVIKSATLDLSVGLGPQVSSTFDLYRALVPWTEGTGSTKQGALALPGETTWNDRLYAAMSPTSWGAPGGLSGVDYASVASASQDISAAGTVSWSGAGLAADVQSWLANPASNHGWFLISQAESVPGTACQINSREAAAGLGPSLRLDYVVPEPATAALMAAGLAVGLIALAWKRAAR